MQASFHQYSIIRLSSWGTIFRTPGQKHYSCIGSNSASFRHHSISVALCCFFLGVRFFVPLDKCHVHASAFVHHHAGINPASIRHQSIIIRHDSSSIAFFCFFLGVRFFVPLDRCHIHASAFVQHHAGINPASIRHESIIIQTSFHQYSIMRFFSGGTTFRTPG